MADPVHEATCSFRFLSAADAAAVHAGLRVEAGDRIPNVDATVRLDEGRSMLELRLVSPDLGDLRAATKSFLTRIRAAASALEETTIRQGSRERGVDPLDTR